MANWRDRTDKDAKLTGSRAELKNIRDKVLKDNQITTDTEREGSIANIVRSGMMIGGCTVSSVGLALGCTGLFQYITTQDGSPAMALYGLGATVVGGAAAYIGYRL